MTFAKGWIINKKTKPFVSHVINFKLINWKFFLFLFSEQEHGYATSLPVTTVLPKIKTKSNSSRKIPKSAGKKAQGNRWVTRFWDLGRILGGFFSS